MRKFEVLQVLCPYGHWAHKNGMQIVDEKSAETLVKNFSSSLLSSFWAGVPVYIGHPDDPENYNAKAKVVGRIKKLCLLDGGIAALTVYSKDIFNKIKCGKIKAMSPRWQMKKNADGSYSPMKLISVGLTNDPNIPGSGRIISVRKEGEIKDAASALVSAKLSALKIAEELAKVSANAFKCGQNAESLGGALKSQSLKMRISELSKDEASFSVGAKKISASSAQKIKAADLPKLARDRSLKLNEPYTKSFAHFKKIYEKNEQLLRVKN